MIRDRRIVSLYHDIEQDIDSDADPDACIEVVYNFLNIEKKYNISATYNIVGSLFEKYPDLIKEIQQQGHEVAFHSYTHNPEWKPQIYSNEIELCRRANNKILGYRSPRSQWDNSTLESLWKNGFVWNAEKDDKPGPYFIYKNIVRLPIATDDWGLHIGEINIEDWMNNFSELLNSKIYFGFGTHDFVFSKDPQRYLSAYEEILKIALDKNVVVSNFFQVADLFRRKSLAEFYTDIGKSWNRDTKVLYRTKRFQELIRSEAEKLDNPVVADLGSGGGVLSTPLQDMASNIYCVDNSPGMLDDITESNIIKSIHGEVTDTSLPADSVDFIICARVLEYISDPDMAADEIKRIGKKGAKFLITVPAFIDGGPSNEGSIPDKLRRHFTGRDVLDWASQIGPGELIGVHYFKGEPKDEKDELRYREIEKEQPEDTMPTNWVFIGTIENKQIDKPYFETLSITINNFR